MQEGLNPGLSRCLDCPESSSLHIVGDFRDKEAILFSFHVKHVVESFPCAIIGKLPEHQGLLAPACPLGRISVCVLKGRAADVRGNSPVTCSHSWSLELQCRNALGDVVPRIRGWVELTRHGRVCTGQVLATQTASRSECSSVADTGHRFPTCTERGWRPELQGSIWGWAHPVRLPCLTAPDPHGVGSVCLSHAKSVWNVRMP